MSERGEGNEITLMYPNDEAKTGKLLAIFVTWLFLYVLNGVGVGGLVPLWY